MEASVTPAGLRSDAKAARLASREKPSAPQDAQADLAAARQLIESCGYWRRKEELEEAEKVILGA
jgi:hypothetical protein